VDQKTDPKDYGTGHIGSEDFGKLQLVPGHKPGRLDARDPFTGQRKCTYEMDLPSFGSVLATGGGLVFNGDPLGNVRAFDAEDGKVVWSFNTGSGLRSGIVSYAVDGKQYILVPSGWGSYAAILLPALSPELENVPGASTLIAFTLDQ
jgi:alcohol dehydrogenase (cytochrome c)